MSSEKYTVCAECGDEIGRYIPCEKVYTSRGRDLCLGCFIEEAVRLVQDDPEWFAALCGVSVREVA